MKNNIEELRNNMLKNLFDKNDELKLSFNPKDDKNGLIGTNPKDTTYNVMAIATVDLNTSNPRYLCFHTDPEKGDYKIITKNGINSSKDAKKVQIYRCEKEYRALNDQYDRLMAKGKKLGIDPLMRSKSIFVQSTLNSGEYKPGDSAELINNNGYVSLNNIQFVKKPKNIDIHIESVHATKSLEEWSNELHIDINTLISIYKKDDYDGVVSFIEEQYIPRYQKLSLYISKQPNEL
jgi:hypothetical protein